MHKYRAINKYLLEGLVNSTIYCASPNKLNDPFDCRVNITDAVSHAILKLPDDKKKILVKVVSLVGYIDRLQADTSNVAVFSGSTVVDDPLLWAHYADEHRGLCLAYDFPESFLDNPDEILGVAPVEYGDNPLTEWIIQNAPIKKDDMSDFTLGVVKKVLSIKSLNWAYEKEVRIIREQEGVFEIEKDHLKQICFGLNAPESDIKLIQRLVKDAGYSVNYCRIIRSKSDFGIEIAEL